MDIIRIENLVTRFGKHVVHDDLNLSFPENKMIGVVGGSGAGKTILLRSIIGLNRPQSGKIWIRDQNVCTLSFADRVVLQHAWGVLFQRGALFSGLTVLENVEVPLREHTHLPLKERHELACLKIKLVGLPDTARDLYPAELSGGMIKRAALARALILDPKILFLDEPTAGLDPISASDFDKLIFDLQRSLHLTVIMITHDVDTIFTLCDLVAVVLHKKAILDTLDNIGKNTDPWIQAYFHGPRSEHLWEGRHGN